MKIRTDFVTNSSSSSFILARKGEFTEDQKQAIMDYIEHHLLGRPVLTPESTEEEIQAFINKSYKNEESETEIRDALREGKTIYSDTIDFECMYGEEYVDVLQNVWKALEDFGHGTFDAIDDDLRY